MSDNSYRVVVSRMTDEELVDALLKHDRYIDEVLLAMLDEVERRNIAIAGTGDLRAVIAARHVPEVSVPEESTPSAPMTLPVFFSQTAILAFTIFFSPLFGGVMLAMNVNRVNKPAVWQILVFSIIFTGFSGYVSYYLAPGSFISLIVPIAGALLLSEVLWNHFIGKNIPYQKRKITVPLIIAAVITIPVAFYVYKHPELFQVNQ